MEISKKRCFNRGLNFSLKIDEKSNSNTGLYSKFFIYFNIFLCKKLFRNENHHEKIASSTVCLCFKSGYFVVLFQTPYILPNLNCLFNYFYRSRYLFFYYLDRTHFSLLKH